jgi:hypothetical protein
MNTRGHCHEAVVAYLKILSKHNPMEMRKTTKILSRLPLSMPRLEFKNS